LSCDANAVPLLDNLNLRYNIREKQNGAQTEFPTFFERENGKLFAFYSLCGLKHNEFFYLKWLKICIFEKTIGQKSEGKNINKIEKY
jgi:hypothetical protein